MTVIAAIIAIAVVVAAACAIAAILLRNPDLERRAKLAERQNKAMRQTLEALAARALSEADVDPVARVFADMIGDCIGEETMNRISIENRKDTA